MYYVCLNILVTINHYLHKRASQYGCRHTIYVAVTAAVDWMCNLVISHSETVHTVRKIRPQKLRTQLKAHQNRKRRLTIKPAMAMQTINKQERVVSIGPDAFEIGVDTRCSACISGYIQDFEGDLQDSTRTIQGFMGARTALVKRGTLKWKWYNDNGRLHTFMIPNSYYVPECKMHLLSP